MSVWDDVVGQEAVIAAFEAAARSARAVAEAREGAAQGPQAHEAAAGRPHIAQGPPAPERGPAADPADSAGPAEPAGPDRAVDGSAMTHAWLITGPNQTFGNY